MESVKDRIERFLNGNSSYGDGSGYGSCSGSGYGSCSGYGSGSGYGDGDGSGYGEGYGEGSGEGYGEGSGDGDGEGYSNGSGYGCGSGRKRVQSYCGQEVHVVDGVPTLIDRVHGAVAKGRILNRDLTTTETYIVKGSGYFAHGDTLAGAEAALEAKIMEGMPIEERIEGFILAFEPGIKYPVKMFYDWHHTLTGSCEAGRRSFARDHEIDIDHDEMTPEEFMAITKDDYGGEIIKQLIDAWDV